MKNLKQQIENKYGKKSWEDFSQLTSKVDQIRAELLKSDDLLKFNYICKKSEEMVKTLINIKVDINSIFAAYIINFIKNDYYKLEDFKCNKASETLIKSLLEIEGTVYKNNRTDLDNLRSMLVAISKDVRVLIIKLTDVLETIKDPKYISDEKLGIVHGEVKEIYAPLAARLGVSFIKSQLENINLKYLKPDAYDEISREIFIHEKERKMQINKNIKKVNGILKDLKVDAEIKGRLKNISSIYKKLQEKAETVSDIYDLLAIRIIVKSVNGCYAALGAIHSSYIPIEGRFKDYIAKPKANGYQSLHTTVKLDNGDPLEVQIRTEQMNELAEYGLASHWMYKEKRIKSSSMDKKLSWVRQVLENEDLYSEEDILETLKSNSYITEIYVQTPKGNIKELPFGSTPVDFAYSIHSEVGERCIGAKVNDKIVSLDTTLNNGETVEIITSSGSKGPSRDWLKFVKTPSARTKIKSFFRKEKKEENIKKGKKILEQAAKNKKIPLKQLSSKNSTKKILKKHELGSMDDLYERIGNGALNSSQVISVIENLKYVETAVTDEQNKHEKTYISEPVKKNDNEGEAVYIEGIDNLLINFAKCCRPIPGDDIVAFISRSRGATIHRSNCSNLKSLENNRLISAKWNDLDFSGNYKTELNIVVKNSPGVLSAITNKIADLGVNIYSVSANEISMDKSLINTVININEKTQLFELIKKLKNMSSVFEVYRLNNS